MQTLLNFRRISKALYNFASTKNPYYPFNPLFEKATISFYYNTICPDIRSTVKEKWDFTQKANLELQVITSSMFVDPPNLKLQSKLVFQPNAVDEFNQVQSLCSNPSNIKNKFFLDSLKIVDCSQIVIDANNLTSFNAFLATIAQNLPNLPSLKTLIIREVEPALSLQFPNSLNALKIIFILYEEKGWLTVENAIKGLGLGLGIYGFYKYWFAEESKEEKKK